MQSTERGATDPQALWRALMVARAVLFVYAVGINAAHADEFERPGVAWAVIAMLGLWTVAAPWLYADPARRPVVIGAEMALGAIALSLTPLAQGHDVHDLASVPTFWIAAPVLAAAVQWGWRGGLVAAAVETGFDLATGGDPIGSGSANTFLLLVTGLVVGYAAELVRIGAQERVEAAAIQAAAAERDRLAREVHDGVLQALAYVQRRGAEIGGPTGELAALAHEHEVALRGLISGSGARPVGGALDLIELLRVHEARGVSVAVPAERVVLPGFVATELAAAAAAALDNSARHAPGAAAYVLVEVDDESVVVSVGDHGPGIPAGRLDEARADGRMGVDRSIRGRLADLGGEARLSSVAGNGTEWELRVPRSRS